MELSEKKLIHFIDSFYTNHLLDFYSYKKLRIAIHFYYHDVCYRELEKIYKTSTHFIHQSIHGDLVERFLGEEFYNLLQDKIRSHNRNTRGIGALFAIKSLSDEELLSISIVKNVNTEIHTVRELKMMKTSILYLEKSLTYTQMASILGYSKSSIGNYLTSEHLQDLLREEYYNFIIQKLSDKYSVLSSDLATKKEKLVQLLQFIEKEQFSLEELRKIDFYSFASQFDIDSSFIYSYFNTTYFEELLFRSCNKNTKGK
ncbi:MAG: hypothetical protein HFJ38_00500 [Bacilli bacterium]|nr:hypothetical protein [Bacilli bacterium]